MNLKILLITLAIGTPSFADTVREFLVKPSTDSLSRAGYIANHELLVGGNFQAPNNYGDSAGVVCIQGKVVQEPKKNERFILQLQSNGSEATLRVTAMGVLMEESISDIHFRRGIPRIGSEAFKNYCWGSYIESIKKGGQMVIEHFLRAKNYSHTLPSQIISVNSAQEAQSMQAVLNNIASTYDSFGSRVAFDDPRPASEINAQILNDEISVKRMTDYTANLLAASAGHLLQLQSLLIQVEFYPL